MGFLDDEIAKYQRRVTRLEENPDPARFGSTKLLYEMWADHRREELRAWRAGEPFVYFDALFDRLLLALGFHLWHLARNADRAQSNAQRYFSLSRGFGFPDMICDRLQVGVGLALSGEIPPPSLILIGHNECTPFAEALKALAYHLQSPWIGLSQVLEASEETLAYCVAQLERMIAYAEANVPGAKMDMNRLVELQRVEAEFQDVRVEMMATVAQIPSPVSGRDGFRLPPFELVGHPRFLEYIYAYRDEMASRAATGQGAVPNEQLRAVWLTSAPFYDDPFAFVAKLGMSVPLYEASLFFPDRLLTWKQWEQRFGRELTPLEREASGMIVGLWRNRVEFVLNACKQFKIDALIHFMLGGCPTSLGSAALLADRAKKELDIPSLMVDGWCMDEEKYDKSVLESRLAEFVQFCRDRKSFA